MKLEDLLKDAPDALGIVQEAIAKANEGQEDKLKHVRFADLSEGEYVSKGKYSDLETENQTNVTKLDEANKLIEQLKKATNAMSHCREKSQSTRTKFAISSGNSNGRR